MAVSHKRNVELSRLVCIKKAPPGAGLSREVDDGDLPSLCEPAEDMDDTPKAQASTASHGRNVEPRSWFLCRASDTKKTPAERG